MARLNPFIMRNVQFVISAIALFALMVACGAETVDSPTSTPSPEPDPTEAPTPVIAKTVDQPVPTMPPPATELPATEPPAPTEEPVAETAPERDLDIVTLLPFDGIPAIDNPHFFPDLETANMFYKDGELVLGVEIDGDARAYSVPLLSSHEIVNDVVGGKPIAVTW